jgi:hypothetical protein
MEVTITQFRREIFSLVNQAMEGTEVWVKHKGGRIKLTPESKPMSRLSRITPMQIINPDLPDFNEPAFKAQMLEEMEAEWEKDWDRDFGPAPNKKSEPGKDGS